MAHDYNGKGSSDDEQGEGLMGDLKKILGDLSGWRELTADEFADWQDDGLACDLMRIEMTYGSVLYFGRDRQEH